MKAFAVFLVVALAVVTAEELRSYKCYNPLKEACRNNPTTRTQSINVNDCNAVYGPNVHNIITNHLIDFANSHVARSFEYLLMSTHYGNYQKNRPGFEKLFRSFSDSKWDEAIDIIKHITTRGGVMKFKAPNLKAPDTAYEMSEIEGLAKSLDMEKELALKAFDVHKEAGLRSGNKHDAEISSYIENEFVHDHAKNIRKLAGYVSDLKSMLMESDRALSLYLFDEYLQKQ